LPAMSHRPLLWSGVAADSCKSGARGCWAGHPSGKKSRWHGAGTLPHTSVHAHAKGTPGHVAAPFPWQVWARQAGVLGPADSWDGHSLSMLAVAAAASMPLAPSMSAVQLLRSTLALLAVPAHGGWAAGLAMAQDPSLEAPPPPPGGHAHFRKHFSAVFVDPTGGT
jgi:hypothetical protein